MVTHGEKHQRHGSEQAYGSAPVFAVRDCLPKGHSKYALSCLMVVFLLIAVWPVKSRAQDGQADLLSDKALKMSGTTGQLERLGGAILSAIPADAFPRSKMRTEVASFIQKEAGKEQLLSIVRAALKEDFNKENIEKVIAFYDSKVGKRIGRLQGDALAPSLLKSVREGRKIAASLKEGRLNLFERIIKAERVSELNRVFLKSVIQGLIDASAAGESSTPVGPSESVQKKIDIMENAIRADRNRTEELALVAFAYTFRSIDDKELSELATYDESPPAVWFRDAVQKGFDRSIYKTAKSLGSAIIQWQSLPPQAADRAPSGSNGRFRRTGRRAYGNDR